MSMLEPRLSILDETDSGLDIDALRVVARGIERLRSPDRSMLIITHHPRLLDVVHPDRVHVLHVLQRGRIVRSGGPELAHELEADGYGILATAVSA
jgi:Fe-S cluster assembly ATP-binding protein